MYAREAENHNNMANSGGSSAQEGNSSKSDDEVRNSYASFTQRPNFQKRPPFSMHGVLHFLEHEWSRYEKERTQWEMERAELRVRIRFNSAALRLRMFRRESAFFSVKERVRRT